MITTMCQGEIPMPWQQLQQIKIPESHQRRVELLSATITQERFIFTPAEQIFPALKINTNLYHFGIRETSKITSEIFDREICNFGSIHKTLMQELFTQTPGRGTKLLRQSESRIMCNGTVCEISREDFFEVKEISVLCQ